MKKIKRYLKILLGILTIFTFNFFISNNIYGNVNQVNKNNIYSNAYNHSFSRSFEQTENENKTILAIEHYPSAVNFSKDNSLAYFSSLKAKNLGMSRNQAIKIANYFNHLLYFEKANNVFNQVEERITNQKDSQFVSLKSNIEGFKYYYGFTNIGHDPQVYPGDIKVATVGDSITYGGLLTGKKINTP